MVAAVFANPLAVTVTRALWRCRLPLINQELSVMSRPVDVPRYRHCSRHLTLRLPLQVSAQAQQLHAYNFLASFSDGGYYICIMCRVGTPPCKINILNVSKLFVLCCYNFWHSYNGASVLPLILEIQYVHMKMKILPWDMQCETSYIKNVKLYKEVFTIFVM